MKLVSSLCLFLLLCTYIKAESITVLSANWKSAYQIQTSIGILTGLCLDVDRVTPIGIPIEYTRYTLAELSGDKDFEKYVHAAKLFSLWDERNREQIQKSIWLTFSPTYTLAFAPLIAGELSPNYNFYVLKTLGSAQNYIVYDSAIPEPSTLLLLGIGLFVASSLCRKKRI